MATSSSSTGFGFSCAQASAGCKTLWRGPGAGAASAPSTFLPASGVHGKDLRRLQRQAKRAEGFWQADRARHLGMWTQEEPAPAAELAPRPDLEFCHQKADVEHLSDRQRRLRGLTCGSWRNRSNKLRRPERMPRRLLLARVPTAAECEAAEAALAWRPGLEEAEEGEEGGKEKPPKMTFEEVRRYFLRQHLRDLQDAGLADVTPAPLQRAVQQRFVAMLEEHGAEHLKLAYHGTPERNLPFIFDQGLRVPSGPHEVANGSAHGRGIYLAEAGAHTLSQGFLRGSSKMLVCGVVDTTEAQTPPATLPWCFGPHRLHGESSQMRKVGSAYVVFQQDFVAPLWVAELGGYGKGYIWDLMRIPSNNNRTAAQAQAQLGTRRCWDGNTEEAVWLVGQPCEGSGAKAQKRRFARRLRHAERAHARSEKRGGVLLC